MFYVHLRIRSCDQNMASFEASSFIHPAAVDHCTATIDIMERLIVAFMGSCQVRVSLY
ncbi:hypothetical protein C8Q75DRAFT_746620 [Abortiporus biennis]|nr:hypothetical protein C8Q75DRAFT_746620 [Abortiporus biennis]